MLAYSYKRFSSKHQAQGHSIERQTKLAEDYCKSNSLELSTLSFEDLGVSAWTEANTKEDAGLGQFLSVLESGAIKTPCYLLVESLDRLSRAKIKVAMNQLWRITDYDVVVVTLLDQKTYTKDMDFTDFLMAGLIMERSHEESQTKSKRLKAAWAKKRSNQDMHSKAPFWLDRIKGDPDRPDGYYLNKHQATVQRVFEMASDGLGHYTITGILNKEQVPSPTARDWNGSSVSKLLRYRQVIGEYQPCTVENKVATPIGDTIKDYYPSAISKELFNKVQLGINQRLKKYKTHTGGSTTTHRNVLRDVGRCSCGKYLSLVKKRQRYYLQCIGSRSGLCSIRAIQMDAFEKFLRQYFMSPIFHNHWVSADKANADIDIKINKLKLEQDESNKALRGLLSVIETNSNPLILQKVSELSERITERSKTIAELEESKGTGNKQQSLYETSKLIDLAYAIEDEPENLTARVKLKQLLNATFDYFEMTRVDSDNGKALYYFIELGFNGKPLKYKSIDAPTALQNANKREIWFAWSDKPRIKLTEEQKRAVIEQFRYYP
ncbi:site-specific recombinase [Vibrio inusitatus NBRC 102082]|uniref:Site-specific recombinase n=1 Tax=Vibrio inusitatus NBRC 102082 TaxID=1219070 RepID=A0A4Y3HSW4_9VIBR|nr:recombinase family protein [Vibrio inusitatus]GEA50041.1 site-specific recombinase [Vibrio inusitatus NBRC 102082]